VSGIWRGGEGEAVPVPAPVPQLLREIGQKVYEQQKLHSNSHTYKHTYACTYSGTKLICHITPNYYKLYMIQFFNRYKEKAKLERSFVNKYLQLVYTILFLDN